MLQASGPFGSSGALLVVAPHPDDEVVGCGGLIALEVAAGRRVAVVVLTDGAGAPQAGVPLAAADLVRVRQAESRAGLERLGGCPVHFAGVASAELAMPAGEARAAGILARILLDLHPGAIAVTAPFEEHATHRRTTAALLLALRQLAPALAPAPALWGYPVWGSLFGMADVAAVDISSVAAIKRAAIACHISQCRAKPYDDGTMAGNRHDAVFSDSHHLTSSSHVELYLDMSELVHDRQLTLAAFAARRAERTIDRYYSVNLTQNE